MQKLLLTALSVLALALLSGCEQDGPAEELGESIDAAVNDAREAGDELTDGLEHSGDTFAENVEDACEEIKDGMDAENPNC